MRYCLREDRQNRMNPQLLLRWETNRRSSGQTVPCGRLHTFVQVGVRRYKIPEGVTALCESCFSEWDENIYSCGADALELPASLTRIEDNTFLFTEFRTIRVAKGSPAFRVKQGGLYSADGRRLIYVLGGEACTEYHVPEGTERIDAGVLNCGGTFFIPASVKKIGPGELYDPESLRIVTPKGSYAARYAQRNGISCELVE